MLGGGRGPRNEVTSQGHRAGGRQSHLGALCLLPTLRSSPKHPSVCRDTSVPPPGYPTCAPAPFGSFLSLSLANARWLPAGRRAASSRQAPRRSLRVGPSEHTAPPVVSASLPGSQAGRSVCSALEGRVPSTRPAGGPKAFSPDSPASPEAQATGHRRLPARVPGFQPHWRGARSRGPARPSAPLPWLGAPRPADSSAGFMCGAPALAARVARSRSSSGPDHRGEQAGGRPGASLA